MLSLLYTVGVGRGIPISFQFRTSKAQDLMVEVRKLMFSGDGKQIVMITDISKFTKVMSAFSLYEKEVHRHHVS